MDQLAGAVEYTDWISAEWYESPNESPGYDTKQSDGKASEMLELWGMRSTPSLPLHCHRSQVNSGLEWSHQIRSYPLVK